jgi:hypothetical protein
MHIRTCTKGASGGSLDQQEHVLPRQLGTVEIDQQLLKAAEMASCARCTRVFGVNVVMLMAGGVKCSGAMSVLGSVLGRKTLLENCLRAQGEELVVSWS